MHSLKFMLSAIAPLTFSVAISAQANTSEAQEAKRTIEEYQDLRRLCAISTSKEKQECFSELSAKTSQYNAAKRVLASAESQDGLNLYVGFAQ